jgi:hypothetical protein
MGAFFRSLRGRAKHLENLRGIASVLQDVNTGTRARAPNSSGTPQGLRGNYQPSLSAETVNSRLMAVYRGQIGLPYFGLSIAATMARRVVGKAREDAFNRLLDRVLLDPETAALLLREQNPANRAAMQGKAKLWLGNQASTVAEMLSDDEDPVKVAIGWPSSPPSR